MRRLLTLLLPLAAACANSSGHRPANVAKPDISVRAGRGLAVLRVVNTARMSIDVNIHNNATVPLLVHQSEVRSPGMMRYTLQRVAKTFTETRPPGHGYRAALGENQTLSYECSNAFRNLHSQRRISRNA